MPEIHLEISFKVCFAGRKYSASQNLTATCEGINFSEEVRKNVKPHLVIDLIHKKTFVTVGHVVVYSQFPEVLFGSALLSKRPVTQFHIYIIGSHDLQYRDGDSKHNLRPFIKTTETELPALVPNQKENG